MHIGFLPDETTKEAAKPSNTILRRIRAVLTGDYFIQNIKINIIQFIDVETTIPSPKLTWKKSGFCSTVGATKHTTEDLQKPWLLFYHCCCVSILK